MKQQNQLNTESIWLAKNIQGENFDVLIILITAL